LSFLDHKTAVAVALVKPALVAYIPVLDKEQVLLADNDE
jgi:hypothetical protein